MLIFTYLNVSFPFYQVKFAEVTLDTFRMLQCLEWEPCGSFPLPGVPGFGESAYPNSHLKHRQEIRDPALPSNPQKTILSQPLIAQYLLVSFQLSQIFNIKNLKPLNYIRKEFF